MKIGVIGYGVVGGATAEVLRRLGNDTRVTDASDFRVQAARGDGFAVLDQSEAFDVLFLCVPEREVEDALAEAPASPVTVIRSTVPPGTTERLSAETGLALTFMPEFLREATALWDALNPHMVVIGTNDQGTAATLRGLFEPLQAPILVTDPTTAEMVKLSLNGYLHTLVSYWNEIHLICERLGISSHRVAKIADQDPRVSSYGAGLHGKPVDGRCLPKDLDQLIALARAGGLNPDLLKSARDVNRKIATGPAARERNGHHDGALATSQVTAGRHHTAVDGRRR
jgi:UDPglucose 6-dehydrogenase